MQQEHNLVPFSEIVQVLKRLIADGESGTMYIVTEEKHWAEIILYSGNIVEIGYKAKHGIAALALIRRIKRARYNFSTDNIILHDRQSGDSKAPLPPTDDIINFLSQSETDGGQAQNRTAPTAAAAAPIAPAPEQSVAKKVLVVEDSTTSRKVITLTLRQRGLTVVEAKDGFEALAQLNNEKPDLVLLDLILPGIDGYKILSHIRKREDFADIPVIILTSRDTLFDKIKGKVSGSDEYLTKPFSPQALMEKVAHYLDLNQA